MHSNTYYVQYKQHKLFNLTFLKVSKRLFRCNLSVAIYSMLQQLSTSEFKRRKRGLCLRLSFASVPSRVSWLFLQLLGFFVGSCVPKPGTQHALHSMCLVLQSGKFVSARPCISTGASLSLSPKWFQAIERPTASCVAQRRLHLTANRVTELRDEASGEKT